MAFWGTIAIFGLCYALFFLVVMLSPFVLFAPAHSKVEWHQGAYYLQYETDISVDTGYHLLYKIDDEKKEILPHVRGYKKDAGFVYFVATQGYAVVQLKDKTVNLVLLSEDIPKVKSEKIQYFSDLSFLSESQQEKLKNVPLNLRAFQISSGKDGKDMPIGDGRFQYAVFHTKDGLCVYLNAYGLYGDYEYKSSLLSEITGYCMDSAQKFYTTAPQGYAIVDGLAGTCRVYFTDPELAEKEYQKDIYVLERFEDFSPDEQEILLQVEKAGLP